MKKELYLFIVWQNARYKEEEILKDISSNYDIAQVFEIKWSNDLFTQNLYRLYGKKLRKSLKKTNQVGFGEFLLVMIYDKCPQYKLEKNLNIISSKQKYRKMTGGGHLIHASDNLEETEEHLLLMLGITGKEFEQRYQTPWQGDVIKINKDPVAAKGWKNESSLISFIDKVDDCIISKDKKTNTIKTKDKSKICRLINASPSILSIINMYYIPMKKGNKLIRIEKTT